MNLLLETPFLGIPRMAVSKISDTSCASVIITFLGIFITDYDKERVLELNLHDLKQDAWVCQFFLKVTNDS